MVVPFSNDSEEEFVINDEDLHDMDNLASSQYDKEGEKGEKGRQGENGEDGENCEDGRQGKQGKEGEKGEEGRQGEKGEESDKAQYGHSRKSVAKRPTKNFQRANIQNIDSSEKIVEKDEPTEYDGSDAESLPRGEDNVEGATNYRD